MMMESTKKNVKKVFSFFKRNSSKLIITIPKVRDFRKSGMIFLLKIMIKEKVKKKEIRVRIENINSSFGGTRLIYIYKVRR